MQIHLIPYNPIWSQLFAQEKAKLQQALVGFEAKIEHIGSTAIPGIYAKPVIDILIGVNQLEQFGEQQVAKLAELGYQYCPAFEQEFPNRRFFKKEDENDNRTHHLHLVNYPSAWWQKHILFRDYLRAQPQWANEYQAHKLALAKQFDDSVLYAKAKTAFCQKINKLAYFDFTVNRAHVSTKRLNGYIPQPVCFELYQTMFQDQDFINCYGVRLDDDQLQHILKRDSSYWDQFRFGPLVWFDKITQKFVGEGGLNHTVIENQAVIELTYSLMKDSWGKGFAVEIGQFAITEAFTQLHLQAIVAFTLVNNLRSQRVMQKLGFQFEKYFTHAGLPHRLYRLKNPA